MKAKKLKGGHYAIIGMIAAIVFIVLFCSFPATASISEKELEGYEVNFDSYPKEREIAYQYYVKTAPDEISIPRKDYIAIGLYDIDNDGKKEIICFVRDSQYCGSGGCAFDILKQSGEFDKQANPVYVPMRWNDPKEDVTIKLGGSNIKILKHTTLGVHDLLLDKRTIWQWQGTYYKRVKTL